MCVSVSQLVRRSKPFGNGLGKHKENKKKERKPEKGKRGIVPFFILCDVK